MMPMGSMMGSSGGWDMGVGGIFMLLPWVVLVTAVVAVIRWLAPTPAPASAWGEAPRRRSRPAARLPGAGGELLDRLLREGTRRSRKECAIFSAGPSGAP